MLHPKQYLNKPSEYDAGMIKKTINKPHNLKTLPVKDLADLLIKGHTIIPAVLEGKGNANSSMWRKQRIFALDFDNDKEVTVSIDEVLKICNQAEIKPAFIYETFSSTDENSRFRVVFITNQDVTTVQERERVFNFFFKVFVKESTTLCDTHCQDKARLFYGGKKLLYEDYSSTVDLEKILAQSPPKSSNDNSSKDKSFRTYNKKFLKKSNYCASANLNMIKYNDIKGLQDILEINPKVFPSYPEAVRYLTCEINLYHYLGIDDDVKMFNCLFHEDHKPSANIIYPSKHDQYFYYCFGCHERGNIIRLTEIIKDCGRMEALNFLFELFQISIIESEQQKIIEENLRIIFSGELEELEPELYKFISRYQNDLITIHNIVKENIYHLPKSTVTEEAIFFFSLRYFAHRIGKSLSTAQKNIALIIFLTLCRRLNDNEVPADLYERAKKFSKDHNYPETIQFYAIPSYGKNTLEQARKRVIAWKENKCTMKAVSRELFYRTFGEEIADEVYPKQTGKELSEKSNIFQKKVDKTLFYLINKQNYATEKQILRKLHKDKAYYQARLKRVIQESLDKYGLTKVKANKHYKTVYDIKQKGYPIIIINESDLKK